MAGPFYHLPCGRMKWFCLRFTCESTTRTHPLQPLPEGVESKTFWTGGPLPTADPGGGALHLPLARRCRRSGPKQKGRVMAESRKSTREPIPGAPPMAPIDATRLPSERDTTPGCPAPECGIDEAERDLAQCLQGSPLGLPLLGEDVVQYLRMRGHSESAAHWALHDLIARGLLILEPADPFGGGVAIYPGGWHNYKNIAVQPTDRLFEPGALTSQASPGQSGATGAQRKDEGMEGSADRRREFDAFVISARGETSTRSFQNWAGGERVTLAIVFTDVVGSTALGEEIRDEAMNEVRRAHFAQSRNLIGQFQGREIKTIGDSFMAAFKCADAALDYVRALQRNTGHAQVEIRAGIHIGPMHVEEGDVFGGTVNFAARVVGAIQGAEIWLSDQAKDDIDRLGAGKHKQLRWERHDGVAMKGFPGVFTLWSLKESLG
jgi:class 3 adenylate cyclase